MRQHAEAQIWAAIATRLTANRETKVLALRVRGPLTLDCPARDPRCPIFPEHLTATHALNPPCCRSGSMRLNPRPLAQRRISAVLGLLNRYIRLQ